MSNMELAQALGISESLLGKWRRGDSKPSLDNAVGLAGQLGCTVEWLNAVHSEPATSESRSAA